MEERSPKRPRPSGDWKPYRREEAEAEEAPEKPQPSGDWRPYERDTEPAPEARAEQAAKDERTEKKAAAGKPADEERRDSADEPRTDEDQRERGERGERGDRGDRGERAEREREQGDQEPSTVDAMGQDKHRKVSGQRYGLSRGRQLLYYGLFVAFVIGAYIGLKAAADSLDKAPAKDPDKAPWSKPDAEGGPLGGFTPSSPDQKGPTDFQ